MSPSFTFFKIEGFVTWDIFLGNFKHCDSAWVSQQKSVEDTDERRRTKDEKKSGGKKSGIFTFFEPYLNNFGESPYPPFSRQLFTVLFIAQYQLTILVILLRNGLQTRQRWTTFRFSSNSLFFTLLLDYKQRSTLVPKTILTVISR